MLAIGWIIVAGILFLIYYIVISPRQPKTLCIVCGKKTTPPVVHDTSKNMYFHPQCWLEYAKQEILLTLLSNTNTAERKLWV